VGNAAPAIPNPEAAGSLGGGDVVPTGAPVDLKVLLKDAQGNLLPDVDAPIDISFPVLAPTAAGGQPVWLQAVYGAGGTLSGYITPASRVDASGRITLQVSIASLQGTLFLPAIEVRAWVQNFDPNVHIFSGWDQQAIDFGPAGPQFTTFTVAQPQVGTRILVFNPLTGNYGWIDATGVGPAGAPA